MKRIPVIRISQEELDERVNQKLGVGGVPEHLQAEYFFEIGKEIQKSEDPVFEPLKPHIKSKDSASWKIAYQIIDEYLRSNHMELTKSVYRFARTII